MNSQKNSCWRQVLRQEKYKGGNNMMSVLEYAQDVNKTVTEILNMCKKLNIPVNSEDDMLDEEAITELSDTSESMQRPTKDSKAR